MIASHRKLIENIKIIADKSEKPMVNDLKNILNPIIENVAENMKKRINYDDIIDSLPGILFEKYLAVKEKYFLSIALPSYKITKSVTDSLKRKNSIYRNKSTSLLDLGFNEDAFLMRLLIVNVGNYLKMTAKMESEETIKLLEAELKTRWSPLTIYTDPEERGLAQIISSFKNIVKDKTEKRAILIARTTVIWSANESAQISYKEAGIKEKEWLTTSDDLSCPYCLEMNGKRTSLESNFLNSEESLKINEEVKMSTSVDIGHPPLHPHCRCVLLPVVD